MLLLLRNTDTFNEHQLGEIYTINEIVSHVVLMTINSDGGGYHGLLRLHNAHGFIHDVQKRYVDLILHFISVE
jgi:hypothetical protein